MTGAGWTPARLSGWSSRLLGLLGRAMGASIERLDKSAALYRARIHRGLSLGGWIYADAVLVHDVWLVVLERPTSAHVIEVDAYTGESRTVASAIRWGRREPHQHRRRSVPASCFGWRGDPVIVSARCGDRRSSGPCGRRGAKPLD